MYIDFKSTIWERITIPEEYEKIALELLRGSIDCNKDSFAGKWDIEWNGLKIDVKMRNYTQGYYKFYSCRKAEADYYLLFCVNNDRIEKILFIPKDIYKQGVGVGKISKYDKYKLVF